VFVIIVGESLTVSADPCQTMCVAQLPLASQLTSGATIRKELTMKKLISAAALAVLVASPVIAQTAQQRASTEASRLNTRNLRQQQPHSGTPAYDVYSTTGQYVGSDPDPRIREMLRRDTALEGND
jgi:hypothetical protein